MSDDAAKHDQADDQKTRQYPVKATMALFLTFAPGQFVYTALNLYMLT